MLLLILPLFCIANGNDLSIGKTITIESSILNETRTILVHLPEGYTNEQTKYPVLYLTDGSYNFLHTVATMNFLAESGRIPQMIVVGVANTDRTRDLTPAILQSEKNDQYKTAGGADNFLQFFEQELIPYVEKHYRTQPYRIFSGHSFGGLFAVNALLNKPELFNAYLAVSPSLWWDNQRLINEANNLLKKADWHGRTLYVSMAAESEDMVTPYGKLVEQVKLAMPKNLTFYHKEFADEDHGSTVLRSHYFGLKNIWDGWYLPFETMQKGFDTVVSHYQNISKKFGFEIPLSEQVVNNVGYAALAEKKFDEAIKAFTYNVETYPQSANVYDSLADAFEAKGELALALKHYIKAVELAGEDHPNRRLFANNKARLAKRLSQDSSAVAE